MDLPICSGLVLRSLGSGTSPPALQEHSSSPVYSLKRLSRSVHGSLSACCAPHLTFHRESPLQKLMFVGLSICKAVEVCFQNHESLALIEGDLRKTGPHCRGPG